jgi:hypothetical protein
MKILRLSAKPWMPDALSWVLACTVGAVSRLVLVYEFSLWTALAHYVGPQMITSVLATVQLTVTGLVYVCRDEWHPRRKRVL